MSGEMTAEKVRSLIGTYSSRSVKVAAGRFLRVARWALEQNRERDEARAEVERLRGMLRNVGEREMVGGWLYTWEECHHCGSKSGMDGSPPELGHADDCPTREPWFSGEEVAGG